MDKIATCGVAVISNPTVCDICVFHAVVLGDIKIICDAGLFWPFSNLNLT